MRLVVKRFPPWLRWLGWGAFAVLFLAICLVVVRWVTLGRGHSRVEEIVARHRPRPSASGKTNTVPGAASQPAADAQPAQESPRGTPVQELPLLGMTFSNDPAMREEFAKRLEEVRRFSQAFREARDTDGVISFRKALENLGVAVPEDMTETEAAAEFLRQTGKISGTLAQLRAALENGPWDWGKWPRSNDAEYFDRRTKVAQMLQAGAGATTGLIQAHWRTGDADGASRDWEMLRLAATRAGEAAYLVGTLVEGSLQYMWARTVGAGISLGGWSDDQLARLSQALAPYDALGSMHRGLEAEKAHLDDLARRPDDVRALMAARPGAHEGFGGMLRRLAIDLTTDQQIRDNMAVFGANYDYSIARLDLEKRMYVPPRPGEQEPSLELLADRSFLTDFYFTPFKELGGDPNGESVASTLPARAVSFQAGTDQARLAAALELERRATGQYPDSLEAVGSFFPGGMPHDVATGLSYFYERTADGAYKLWGTGIDQENDSGDSKRDILFTSPKLQPH